MRSNKVEAWFASLALPSSLFALLAPATAQCFPAQFVNALQRAEYSVYRADINSDLVPDYLVKAKLKIVLIDFDIAIPIPLRPASPTFLLRSQGGGSYVLEISPSETTVENPLWQLTSDALIYGDVQGVGTNAMLIQSRTAGLPSFVISTRESDGQPVLLQQVTAAQLGVDLGAAAVTAALIDISRDGRADLVIRTNGRITDVFIASGEGLFAKPSDEEASIAPWYAFSAALDVGDVQSATNFISTDSVPKYTTALTALGAGVSGLTRNWSAPVPVLLQSGAAVYMIRENFGGVQRSYLVTIVQENGRWLIDEL